MREEACALVVCACVCVRERGVHKLHTQQQQQRSREKRREALLLASAAN